MEIVLLSGGLDSSTLCIDLIKSGHKIESIFIDYGQKTAQMEFESAKKISEKYGFPLRRITNHLNEELNSGCLFEKNITLDWENNLISYLPQRNLLLLTLASMYASNNNINNLYIGLINSGENWFPDATTHFVEMAESCLQLCHPQLKILAPYINIQKHEIVKIAKKLNFDLQYTFSCDMGTEHHCMTCPSCVDRFNSMK